MRNHHKSATVRPSTASERQRYRCSLVLYLREDITEEAIEQTKQQ